MPVQNKYFRVKSKRLNANQRFCKIDLRNVVSNIISINFCGNNL